MMLHAVGMQKMVKVRLLLFETQNGYQVIKSYLYFQIIYLDYFKANKCNIKSVPNYLPDIL